VGDMTCTAAIASEALSVQDIIEDIKNSRISERGQTRLDDLLSSLTPVKIYRENMELASKEKQDNVFVLNQFTLLDKQVLVVKINERNGVRNQVLKIKSSDLQKVKQLNEIKF